MKGKKLNKRGLALPDMGTIALLFVITGVTLGLGVMVTSEMNSLIGTPSGGTGEFVNASLNTTAESVGQLSSWLPIIAVVISAGLVIGTLAAVFAMRN